MVQTRMLRHRAILSAALIASSSNVFAYDSTAHIGATFITSPLFPTSASECRNLKQRLDRKRDEIVVAHDACLKEAGDEKYSTKRWDSKSECTKSACQSLHDGRDSFQEHAQKEMAKCEAQLQKHEAEQAARAEKQRQREQDEEMARANASQCGRDWLSYKQVCTGTHATASDQRTCKRELERLREECPR